MPFRTTDHTLDIAVGRDRLAGTLVSPRKLMPGVLFVHGWGGSQAQYLARAREVASLGCVCLAFDLTGHAGTSARRGSVSRERNLEDVLAAYDLLAGQPHVDGDAMAVVGSSYGGYLASILTELRPVHWLALRVPALYHDDGWDTPKLELHQQFDLRSYRQQRVAVQKNRALKSLTGFRGDVLLVESEFDDLIPHAVISSYREACAGARTLTSRVMKGADHGLSDVKFQQGYTDLLRRWLGEMLAERAGRHPGARPAHDQASQTLPAPVAPEEPPRTNAAGDGGASAPGGGRSRVVGRPAVSPS